MAFTYTLINTSREKGVCLNWPPNPEADTPYDLQFEPARNPDHLIDAPYLGAYYTGTRMLTGTVNVSCFDYGAWGEFQASATLENGQVVYGTVRGSNRQTVKLPERRDGSHIANAYFRMHRISNLPDEDDSENDPVGDGFKGDGLTLYEEYRGFMNGAEWTPGDPITKDVFVLNDLRYSYSAQLGIGMFEQATGLKVHRLLRDNQVDANKAINFHRTAGAHVVDQHVIHIKAGLRVAQGATFANAADVGTPGTAKYLLMPPDLAAFRGLQYFASTIAHEMLHCCNVYHHGQRDKTVWWYHAPPGSDVFEDAAVPNQAGNALVRGGSPVAITVRKENGSVVRAQDLFASGRTEMLVTMGMPHGEHCGVEDCIMRYDVSVAYPAAANTLLVTATRQPDAKLAATPLPTDLRVKLTDERGREIAAKFEPARPTPDSGTSLYWLAAEAETAGLVSGRYRLTLVTGAGGAPPGWRVEIGEFQVVAPSQERRGAAASSACNGWCCWAGTTRRWLKPIDWSPRMRRTRTHGLPGATSCC